jgi:hypothetical protein
VGEWVVWGDVVFAPGCSGQDGCSAAGERRRKLMVLRVLRALRVYMYTYARAQAYAQKVFFRPDEAECPERPQKCWVFTKGYPEQRVGAGV